jgi:transcriptional regulator NrdR family protein
MRCPKCQGRLYVYDSWDALPNVRLRRYRCKICDLKTTSIEKLDDVRKIKDEKAKRHR